MLALEVLGGVVVLLGLAALLARTSPGLEDEPEDTLDSGLPSGRPLRSDDIPRLRFRVGLRGYRMTDVDAALDAVQAALAAAEGRPAAGEQGPERPDSQRSGLDRSGLEQSAAGPADDS